jgi:hypothetical protein
MMERDGAEMRVRTNKIKNAAEECAGAAGSSCLVIDMLAVHMMSL